MGIDIRKFIGTRMTPADIGRAEHSRRQEARIRQNLDERYGPVITGVCPECGGPVRKPARGPAARFCSRSCKTAYNRRQAQREAARLAARSQSTAAMLQERGESYRARARAIRDESSRLRQEASGMRAATRTSLMCQLLTIMRADPSMIRDAAPGGHVCTLIARIDLLGEPGDAERMLRHQGYTLRMPVA